MNPIGETVLTWPRGYSPVSAPPRTVTSCWVLGCEGQFDTGTGVTLVTPNTLQAAVVVKVTDAGGTDTVHFSMGELCAFNIHFNLLSL